MQRLNCFQGNRGSKIIFVLIISLVTAVDQLSKFLVRDNLYIGESVPEEGILRLTHVTNDGAVFGLPSNMVFSIIIPILIIIVVFFLHYKYSLLSNILANVSLGLIIGGGIGNLIDRIHQSYVTDFVDIRLWSDFHWPTFNVADTTLVIGTILFVYFLLNSKIFQSVDTE